MPHHGPVQPVLGHDAAPPPGLACLPLLRSPVLKPDLEHKQPCILCLNDSWMMNDDGNVIWTRICSCGHWFDGSAQDLGQLSLEEGKGGQFKLIRLALWLSSIRPRTMSDTKTDLDSVLWKVCFEAEHFTSVHVRVMSVLNTMHEHDISPLMVWFAITLNAFSSSSSWYDVKIVLWRLFFFFFFPRTPPQSADLSRSPENNFFNLSRCSRYFLCFTLLGRDRIFKVYNLPQKFTG